MRLRRRQVVQFLWPWAVGFLFLTLLPMIASLGLSFTRVDPGFSSRRTTWVGAEHYKSAWGVDTSHTPTDRDPLLWRMLGGRPTDPRAYTALLNSLYYTALAVPLGLCLSLAAALLLSPQVRGMSFFRAAVYLPHALGGVATIVIWSWLLNPQFGWVNRAIALVYGQLGLQAPQPGWLYSPTACIPALVIMHAWAMGGSMLIFLAALRRVPPSLMEAASLDGAGRWRLFRHVTIPQITPAILFNLTLGVVFAMQSFSEPYLLQNRQQGDGLLFYVLYLYQVAFESPYQLGYASALAWSLFGVLFLLVIPLLWTSRRFVHYAVR